MQIKRTDRRTSARDGESRTGGRTDPDSRARTHLASERTFLAWLRTGLGLNVLGLAAAQFIEADRMFIPGLRVGLRLRRRPHHQRCRDGPHWVQPSPTHPRNRWVAAVADND